MTPLRGLLVAALLFSTSALAQSRDWAFIQSVGGLAYGAPVYRNGAWYLPIRCDVSGFEAVTTKPTAVHPTLACTTAVRVDGRAIVLTVMTRGESGDAFSACAPVRLGNLEKGRYAVIYSGSASERVEIGEAYIPR